MGRVGEVVVFWCLWSVCASEESSCARSFHLLERSLLQCADNRYNLLRAFYPPRASHPVVVEINYTFSNSSNNTNNISNTDSNDTRIWFWTESTFYLVQPLEVFQFSSLFFSNTPNRRTSASLQLPTDCSIAGDDFFQLLTKKVCIYKVYSAGEY